MNTPLLKSWASSALWLGLAGLLSCTAAQAGKFPAKPIRIIVGFAPGGGVDAQARIVAEGLQRKYGQAVTVENRPGAGGRLAAEAVARAEADGYTLGAITGADSLLAVTEKKLPYRYPDDFQYLTMVASYPFAIVTAANSPYRTFPELLQAARKPGVVTSASAGIGTTHHLAAELLGAMGGVDILHVPYKGSASANTDVVSGRVTMQFAAAPAVLASGQLRALAVTSPQRSATWPGVPAVAEFIPEYEVTSWMGMIVPAKTPPAVGAQLTEDIHEILKSKDVRQRMQALGLDLWTTSSADMRARAVADMDKWRKLLQTRDIQVSK